MHGTSSHTLSSIIIMRCSSTHTDGPSRFPLLLLLFYLFLIRIANFSTLFLAPHHESVFVCGAVCERGERYFLSFFTGEFTFRLLPMLLSVLGLGAGPRQHTERMSAVENSGGGERETESDSGHRKALSGHPVERHGAPRTGLNSRGAGIHHNTAIWPGIKRWVAELLAEYTRARTIKTIETGEISSRIERDHVGHEVFCFCKWNIFYDSLNKVISRIVLLGDSKESWEGYLSFYVHCRKTGKLKVVTEEVGNVWNSILFKI